MSPSDLSADEPTPEFAEDPSNEYGPDTDLKARYWAVVRRTVREVFNGDDGDIGRVEQVRTRVERQPPGTQEKFYQTEPYTVAADIKKVRGAGSVGQQGRYLNIKREENFGPVEIPSHLEQALARYR